MGMKAATATEAVMAEATSSRSTNRNNHNMIHRGISNSSSYQHVSKSSHHHHSSGIINRDPGNGGRYAKSAANLDISLTSATRFPPTHVRTILLSSNSQQLEADLFLRLLSKPPQRSPAWIVGTVGCMEHLRRRQSYACAVCASSQVECFLYEHYRGGNRGQCFCGTD